MGFSRHQLNPFKKTAPEVRRVLQVLKDPSLARPDTPPNAKLKPDILYLIGSSPLSSQTDLNVSVATESINRGVDAIIMQTFNSGTFPSRDYPSYLDVMSRSVRGKIPFFLVKEANYPQKYIPNAVISAYGGIELENAFSAQAYEVIDVITRAFRENGDANVVAPAVQAFYE